MNQSGTPATINGVAISALNVEQTLTTSSMIGCTGVALAAGEDAARILWMWIDQEPLVYVGPIKHEGRTRDATINIKLDELAMRDDRQVAVRFSNRGAVRSTNAT